MHVPGIRQLPLNFCTLDYNDPLRELLQSSNSIPSPLILWDHLGVHLLYNRPGNATKNRTGDTIVPPLEIIDNSSLATLVRYRVLIVDYFRRLAGRPSG